MITIHFIGGNSIELDTTIDKFGDICQRNGMIPQWQVVSTKEVKYSIQLCNITHISEGLAKY